MEITNNLSEKALYDYKIVRNAIAGDEKAYGELFKRYKDSVYFMIVLFEAILNSQVLKANCGE